MLTSEKYKAIVESIVIVFKKMQV